MDKAKTAGGPITSTQLREQLGSFPPPQLVDVRAPQARAEDPFLIPGARLADVAAVDAFADDIEPWRPVTVYCAHGQVRSQQTVAALTQRGFDARYLDGGLDAWRASDNATEPMREPTRWVTRERPKIDRIACPWLVRRFIDPAAEFFYVPAAEVREFARKNAAEAYDIPDVKYSHVGELCSFDAFIRLHHLDGAALADLALIVRGADTDVLALAAQAPGLKAFSLGLSHLFTDDHTMLRWGMLFYDALYTWCREGRAEAHSWNPASLVANVK